MSIVSPPVNMQSSSNIFHISSSSHDSTFNRKRFLDTDELIESSKRSRTAPPSPPLVSSFRSRSLSPSPPSSSSANIRSHQVGIALSPPVTSFSLATPITPHVSINNTSAKPVTKLPSIKQFTSEINTVSPSLTLPKISPSEKALALKYLSKNTRYGNTNHALDYPDTCVNDDDWRLNLEIWIEKNFPEKFNNLKNVLRFDKPGFDLLNDAILLTELKQQLEQQYTSKKPSFNSRISSKMMSPDSRKNYTFHKNMSESLSDDESSVFHHWNHTLSPISKQTQIENNSSSSNYHHQISISTSQQHNYTYKTTQPSSPTQQYVPSRSSPLTSPQPSHPKVASSSANEPVMSSWSGHHNTENPVVLKTETFIHTQNHKGPNHTYTIHHHNLSKRKCISCHSDQSPCWRPSWSTTAGQLCNSCGLRYKKTGARCTIDSCRRIPAKGEWAAMKQRGKVEVLNSSGEKTLGYSCLNCSGEVEVKEKK